MQKRSAAQDAGAAADRSPDGPDAAAHEGVLAELIEVEHAVREAVLAAEAEAERAIAEAESQAHARSQQDDAALEQALRALESRFEQERAGALADIARRSDEAAARHRDVDETRLRALAELVARRVAEDGSGA